MSFTRGVKDELCQVHTRASHCRQAELLGMLMAAGVVSFSSGGPRLSLSTEHRATALRAAAFFEKDLLRESELLVTQQPPKNVQTFQVRVLSGVLSLLSQFGVSPGEDEGTSKYSVMIESDCCKSAFLRGAFLGNGNMADPKRRYHLEFLFSREEFALFTWNILKSLFLNARRTVRKELHVVYLKNAEDVVSLLTHMGAHGSVLEMENIRILKEIRNQVNRQTNFDNANIDKTVDAAMRQTKNIKLIEETIGFDRLPAELAQTARLRLANPEASLTELAALSADTTRSGVNHRLRRLAEIAGEIRKNKGESP